MTRNIPFDIHADSVDNIKTELQHKVMIRALACIAMYNDKCHPAFTDPIKIDFNIRGRTAGRAYTVQRRISFNNHLLETYGERFIDETVAHEMAHILCEYQTNRNHGHDYVWQSMAIMLGDSGKTKHNYKTQVGRYTPKYSYRCECRLHKVGQQVHDKMSKYRSTYTCNDCGGMLIRVKPKVSKLAQQAILDTTDLNA